MLGLSSCFMSTQIANMQIEVMKPGIFEYPEEIKKAALFKRYFYRPDTSKVFYIDHVKFRVDTTISYSSLSDHCINSVESFLNSQGYFKNTVNYGDSLKSWSASDWERNKKELFRTTGADLLIGLDYLYFADTYKSIDSYLIKTVGNLMWSISFRNDSSEYIYNQSDTLTYENELIKVKKDQLLEHVLADASKYLGESFGAKLIPNWTLAERMYYLSGNLQMQKAEEFAKKDQWLDAAEIWKKETTNKNKRIAAKATYNMALACEMEGKLDLGIDWLVKSYSILPLRFEDHKRNCQQYITVLARRKKEIDKLNKQIKSKQK